MSIQPFTPPSAGQSAFNCPFCKAFSNQVWGAGCFNDHGHSSVDKLKLCFCSHCSKYTIWVSDKMVYPDESIAPLPNPDLPKDIEEDFVEARNIINRSPRGAAALLRLCIQKLCAHLGESGKNINKDIASLVKKGLNPRIQKSLDIVRVIGNEAVHPGTIDLRDDKETAVQLSKMVNFIAETMISQPKEIDELYETLPDRKREEIQKRDSTTNEGSQVGK